MASEEPDARPSWMGAPGYVPHPELPPHAPMPGAPPYPEQEEPPPLPAGRTPFPLALVATLVWAAVNLVLVLVVSGLPPSAALMGRTVGSVALTALFAAVVTWVVARRHGWAFRVLLLVAAPCYWVLRALTSVPGAAS